MHLTTQRKGVHFVLLALSFTILSVLLYVGEVFAKGDADFDAPSKSYSGNGGQDSPSEGGPGPGVGSKSYDAPDGSKGQESYGGGTGSGNNPSNNNAPGWSGSGGEGKSYDAPDGSKGQESYGGGTGSGNNGGNDSASQRGQVDGPNGTGNADIGNSPKSFAAQVGEAMSKIADKVSSYFGNAVSTTVGGLVSATKVAMTALGIAVPTVTYTDFENARNAAMRDQKDQDMNPDTQNKNTNITDDELTELGIVATPGVVNALKDNDTRVTYNKTEVDEKIQSRIDQAFEEQEKALAQARAFGVTQALPPEIASYLAATSKELADAEAAKVAAEQAPVGGPISEAAREAQAKAAQAQADKVAVQKDLGLTPSPPVTAFKDETGNIVTVDILGIGTVIDEYTGTVIGSLSKDETSKAFFGDDWTPQSSFSKELEAIAANNNGNNSASQRGQVGGPNGVDTSKTAGIDTDKITFDPNLPNIGTAPAPGKQGQFTDVDLGNYTTVKNVVNLSGSSNPKENKNAATPAQVVALGLVTFSKEDMAALGKTLAGELPGKIVDKIATGKQLTVDDLKQIGLITNVVANRAFATNRALLGPFNGSLEKVVTAIGPKTKFGQFSAYNEDAIAQTNKNYGKNPKAFDAVAKAFTNNTIASKYGLTVAAPMPKANVYYNPYVANPAWKGQVTDTKTFGTNRTDTHIAGTLPGEYTQKGTLPGIAEFSGKVLSVMDKAATGGLTPGTGKASPESVKSDDSDESAADDSTTADKNYDVPDTNTDAEADPTQEGPRGKESNDNSVSPEVADDNLTDTGKKGIATLSDLVNDIKDWLGSIFTGNGDGAVPLQQDATGTTTFNRQRN